jgi:cAMP-dependent protein kinase regulator
MATLKDQLTTDLSKFVAQAQWAKAVQALEGLIKLEPTNAQYYLRLGDYCVKAGNKVAAVQAYYQAADLFVKAGFSIKGIAACKMILKIAPEETRAIVLMKAAVPLAVPSREQSLVAPPAPGSGDTKDINPLFASFTKEEFGAIVDKLEPLEFMDGERIIAEGDEGDALYLISRSGGKVVKRVAGQEVVLAELGEGEFFGEMSLLVGGPRSASVFALGETQVLRLKSADLFEIMKHYPRLEKVFEEFYEDRSRATRQKIRALRQ